MNLEKALSVINRHFGISENGQRMSSPTRQAFLTIKREQPQTRQHFEKLFKMVYLGKGCSRQAWAIEGTHLVVKFEEAGSDYDTKREFEIYETLRHRRECRQYLPHILYRAHGILVLPRYTHLDESEHVQSNKARENIKQLFNLAGVEVCDLHHKNVMRDKIGHIRCSDMGQFFFKTKPQEPAQ